MFAHTELAVCCVSLSYRVLTPEPATSGEGVMRSKRYLRHASLVLAVLVSLVIALSIPAQGTSPGHGQGKTAISPESTTTQSCFSSGLTASFFKVCVLLRGGISTDSEQLQSERVFTRYSLV